MPGRNRQHIGLPSQFSAHQAKLHSQGMPKARQKGPEVLQCTVRFNIFLVSLFSKDTVKQTSKESKAGFTVAKFVTIVIAYIS